ncbi:mechanosensitive ion channel domain-containing protein [Acidobacteriota bacterium]
MIILKRYFRIFFLGFLLYGIVTSSLLTQVVQDEKVTPQERQEGVATPPKKGPQLEPIPAFDIALRSEEVNSDLNTIRSAVNSDPRIAKIKSEEQDFRNDLKKSKEKFQAVAVSDLSLKKLKDFLEEWQIHKAKVNTWLESVAARSQLLEVENIKLQKIKELWELTRVSAAENNYPQALKERIAAVLSEIREVEMSLKERQEQIFSLEGKISDQSVVINDVLSQIDSAFVQSRQKLFSHDSPPLWKALFATEVEIPVFKQTKETWQQKAETLARYLNDNWERLLINVFIFMVLSAILFKLLRQSQEWSDEDEERNALAKIFKHPFSIALLITLLMASWIFPQAPLILFDLVGILFLIPLISLVPVLVPSSWHASLYGLGGLYLLQSIYLLMPERSAIQRLIFFLTVSLALTGLIWLLKKGGILFRIKEERQKKAVILLARSALVLLAIAWFTNIFGFTYLASLLVEGTLLSIYFLVILLVSVVVLEGLIAVFLRSQAAQALRIFRLHLKLWKIKTSALLRFGAVVLWIYLTLENFTVLDPVINFLTKAFGHPLRIGSLNIALGDILAFILTLWVSILLARFIRFVLGEDVLPRLTLPRGVPGAISFVAYYFILIVGFLFALSAAGVEWSRFALLAGALGIGIGFGLQNLVNNFISGLILIFEHPIKIGDMIEFGSQRGRVLRIGIRSSTILNWEGAEVIVPNGNLISGEVVNWTLSDRRRRLCITVGVAYGTDPNLVLKILKEVAKSHSSVLDSPAPDALFTGFGDSSLDFELRFSIPEFDGWLIIKSEITLAINNALKEANIVIPFPQRDLHLRSIDSEAKTILTPKKDNEKSKVK